MHMSHIAAVPVLGVFKVEFVVGEDVIRPEDVAAAKNVPNHADAVDTDIPMVILRAQA